MDIADELQNKLDRATSLSKIGWDLKKHMKIFIDPEARCPYCNGWFHTGRVWLINDKSHHIKGCWNLDGSSIAADKIIHPHAWMSGEVCIGKADCASEALFAGVDKGKHVHYVPRWLVQLGHECNKLPYMPCPICNEKFFDDVIRFFGYRNHKVCSDNCLIDARDSRCEDCLKEMEAKTGRFCSGCEERLTISCSVCNNRMLEHESFYYSRKDLRCCHDCYKTRLRNCMSCGYQEQREEINSLGFCEVCRIDPPVRCSDCGDRMASASELTDGLCRHCYNYCAECDCSPCECQSRDYHYDEEEESDEY